MTFVHVWILMAQLIWVFYDWTTMTILTCPWPDCRLTTEGVDIIGAAAILNVHSHLHAANTSRDYTASAPHAPRLERPRLQMNATTEDWSAFICRWETFHTGSSIPNDAASDQLLECTDEQLGNIVLRASPSFTFLSMWCSYNTKTFAVIPVAFGAVCSILLSIRQDPDKPFRTFAEQVQGKAESAEFKTFVQWIMQLLPRIVLRCGILHWQNDQRCPT